MRLRIMQLEDRIMLDAALVDTVQEVANNPEPVQDVAVADMNGDGSNDIVTAEHDQGFPAEVNAVVLYTNDGDGNFTETVIDNDAPNWTNGIAVGDLDGDGDNDIIACGSGDGKVNLYTNDGNGNFVKSQIGQVSAAIEVKIGDIDSDGDNDVIAMGISQLAYFKNNGTGIFGLKQIIDNDLFQARQLEMADFDNDGDNDILVTERDNQLVSIFENDNLNFTKEIIDNSLSQPYSVNAFDFDGDNDIDFFTTSLGNNEIDYFENDGAGNFTKELIDDSLVYPRDVNIIDFNNDGNNEFIVAFSGDDTVSCYDENYNSENIGTVDCASCLVIADIDGDGKDDIVVGGSEADNGELVWFKNISEDSVRSFNPAPIEPVPVDPDPIDPQPETQYIDVVHLGADAGYKSSFWVSWEEDGELIEKMISQPINENNYIETNYRVEVPRLIDLDFFIETTNNNNTWRHYSDGEYANVQRNADGFTIYFEDLPAEVADWDFNDQVFKIIENPIEEAVEALQKAAKMLKWF